MTLDPQPLLVYIPMDRRQALAHHRPLPDRSQGAALFADISGFTPLTEALLQELGRLRGAEELTQQLNTVYTALIDKVHQYGGSVISFSGDAITCWFNGDEGMRATACALAMQQVMTDFAEIKTPAGTLVALAIKVALTTGPVRRFLVGDEQIQRIDVLAGVTLDHMAAAEKQAERGEVVLGPAILAQMAKKVSITAWRTDNTGQQYAVVDGLLVPVTLSAPWPELAPTAFTTEQLRSWLLPPVYERLETRQLTFASGQRQFLAELRPAVTLFLRFSGLDYDGDDGAGMKLDRYICWVQRVLAGYDGYLLQLTVGDKGSYFYAVFGAPLAHDDDPARAVAAALELRTPPAEFAFVTPPQIGISQGRMRTGAYGSDTRQTYGVLGDEVNTSARLMALAQPGQILLSSHLAEQVTRHYECRSLGEQLLKGKQTAQVVYELIGRQVTQERPSSVFTHPLVGRQVDLRQMQAAAKTVLAGQGQIVRLQGGAGIGKSHLAAAFSLRAQQMGFRTVAGTCQSTTQGTPYFPWRQIFRNLLGLETTVSDTPAQTQADMAQLEANLNQLNPDWTLRLPLLGDLLGLPIPDNNVTAAFDPRLRQEALFTLVVDMIQRWAGERPLLLLLEDIHWLDEVSLNLTLNLSRSLPNLPLLLLLVHRPPLQTDRPILPELETLPYHRPITLAELSDEGVAALLEQRLEGILTPLTLALIQAQAQGNPYFVEELANALREAGHLYLNEADQSWRLSDQMFAALRQANALVKEQGEWMLAPTVSLSVTDLGIPDSIHGLVLSRLDRLSEEAKLTLKVASVIGRTFGLLLLNHVHPAQPELILLREQIDQVEERDFVRLEIPAPQLVYIFKHNTTQDVAYQTLLFAQRRALHQVIAEWYETTYEGDGTQESSLAAYFPLLAYHWRQAEVPERERHYARLAGKQAAARFANEEAVTYLSRALELTPAELKRERYELYLGRTAVYHLAGLRDEQAEDLVQLQLLADSLDEAAVQAAVALHFARYYEAMSDYGAAELSARQAVDWAEKANDPQLKIKGLIDWGLALWRRGELETAQHPLTDSLILARNIGDKAGEATSLHHLGTVSYYFGNLAESHRYLEDALQIRYELENLPDQAASLTNLVGVYHALGDYARSEQMAREALSIYQTIGNRREEATVLNNLAAIHHTLGQLQTARIEHQQALALYQTLDNRLGESLAANNLALVLYDLSEYEEARRFAQRALQIDRAIGDKVGQGYSLTTLGLALEGSAAWAEAAPMYAEAQTIRQQIGQHSYAIDDLAGLARVALAQGDLAQAQAYAREVQEWLAQNGTTGMEHPLRLYLTLAAVAEADGQRKEAAHLLHEAVEMVRAQAERISDETVRQAFLAEGPLHQTLYEEYSRLGEGTDSI
jgi:class 3 adenylate cyclase/tetratricopeptide (TPR) repeat protein